MASSTIAPRPIAPATSNGQAQEERLNPAMSFACTTCTRRKVRCDKVGPPCSTCRKSRLECHYEAPAPRKRKRKPADDVHEKLERYGSVLKRHGLLEQANADSTTDQTSPDSASTLPTNVQSEGRSGMLLSGRGKSRYIDSTLWRNLRENDLNISSDEEDNDEERDGTVSRPNGPDDPLAASIVGGIKAHINLLDYHPTYDVAVKLYRTYCSHVESIAKILHVPTGLALVQRAASNPSTASKATECFLFAIYHFAVVAMTDEECQKALGQQRSILQARYYDAVRQALVNAHFLRTSELVVLQAYIMFLLSVRPGYDAHTFWVLTGVAVRIAQRMGLHRDGEALGLNPFDVEIRRRVFWQLLPLDGMSAQVSGTGIALPFDSWDTQQASNLNDEDIWPDMKEKPKERKGATDMMFCLCRAEVGKFHQKGKPSLGLWGRLWEAGDANKAKLAELESSIDDLERTLEDKFFRYCDLVEPFHCLTLAMGRGALTNARLRLRLPRLKADLDSWELERSHLMSLALKVLDYTISVLSNPLLMAYSWHFRAFFQWEPLIWVLSELRRGSPAIADPAAVWAKIDTVFQVYPHLTSQKRALNVAICKLTVRTWDSQPFPAGPEPPFIQPMRAFGARREGSISTSDSVAAIDPNLSTPSQFTMKDLWTASEGTGILPVPNYANEHELSAPAMMEDYNPEPFDWAFWDHLMRDPDGLLDMPPST